MIVNRHRAENHFNKSVLVLQSLVLLSLLPACIGCGSQDSLHPVSGKVLMDGVPFLEEGFVRIEPANFRAVTGRIDPADGSFQMDGKGVIQGTHAVAVIVTRHQGYDSYSLIDEKYASAKTSGLSATIDGPTEQLTLELSGGIKDLGSEVETVDEGVPDSTGKKHGGQP